MANLTVSSAVDTLMQATTAAGIATAAGLGTGNSPTFTAVNATKATVGSGVTKANEFSYSGAPGAAAYPFALVGTLTLNGSTAVSSGEHGAAAVGQATDGATNDHSLIGVEGKAAGTGTADYYAGLAGVGTYQGASFAGTVYGSTITQLQITTDGSTPLAQGTAIGYYVPPIVGGANKFAFYGSNPLRLTGPAGSGSVTLEHDGTFAYLGAGSTFLLLRTGTTAFAPETAGTSLGHDALPWALIATKVKKSHTTLTYAATTDIDLDGAVTDLQTLTLTGNVTLTTSNRAAGCEKKLRIIASGGARTFTALPSWVWVGGTAPASLASGKTAILTLTCFGTADTDIVAKYEVQS